ncbi:acyl-CoA dehydrogenase C-terminal domain-containing protein [Marinobacter antarcticus]|uniref:acyl-CoA dehydrogenase C-terminal domain-containing protein n=1 Tax=Marinobacter antarcticus TaxID=564117 RepID=UPI000AA4FC3A|nr:acyl-CoA dehydrogenase C-terminal domain-containing protein [Marinobacter antarcticus]
MLIEYAKSGFFDQLMAPADRLDKGGDESEAFYKAKLATAEFYYERLLPRAHAGSMMSHSKNLMQLSADDMAFTG